MCPTIRIPIKWSADISAKDLKEYLLAQERMRPVIFIIPVKHSAWLEFRHRSSTAFLGRGAIHGHLHLAEA